MKRKQYDVGILEFELADGRKIRKKIKLPVLRYKYGIYKIKGSHVQLSGWRRNPRKYGYGGDNYLIDTYPIPEGTKVVRLIVGKRVVSRYKR